MSEEPQAEHETVAKAWYRHELLLFITSSIILAALLVTASMALYASSGAALLDLSRPGYKSVQNQVIEQSDRFESFSASGEVTKETLEQFQRLYEKQAKTVTEEKVFSGSTLDYRALGLDNAPVVTE